MIVIMCILYIEHHIIIYILYIVLYVNYIIYIYIYTAYGRTLYIYILLCVYIYISEQVCVLRKYITIINYIYIMYISMYTYIMDTPSADPMLRCFYGFCRISAVTIEKHQHPSFHYVKAPVSNHFSIANLETRGKCSTIVS